MVMQDQAWNGFAAGEWQRSIDVRSFIQKNWTPYLGDDAFLAGPTQRTKAVWKRCEELLLRELKDGILDVDTHRVSGIDNYAPGYIDRENEVIVGLQTDAPLKRIVNLYGGTRMAKSALEQYGYQLDPEIEAHFTEYRKTHNEGVFDAYPERTRAARHAGLLTGLPDAYGRGRIIGDYRRVALYGVDRLIEWKKRDLEELDGPMGEERIRLREEVSEQIRALGKMKDMASHYGVDLSRPAANAHDAIQALYMAYLAGIKENNGAATSLGRTSTFVDIYLQRDLENGVITEEEAQELVDQFIIKLRLVRHLRTPEYNELFGGDPTWVTESIGGMSIGGRPWSPAPPSAICTPSPTWAVRPSPTSPSSGPSISLRALSATAPRCPLPRTPFSMKMMMSCARCTEMTTRLPAVCPPWRWGSRCSSSGPGATLPSACCTPSTAAWMSGPGPGSSPASSPSPTRCWTMRRSGRITTRCWPMPQSCTPTR